MIKKLSSHIDIIEAFFIPNVLPIDKLGFWYALYSDSSGILLITLSWNRHTCISNTITKHIYMHVVHVKNICLQFLSRIVENQSQWFVGSLKEFPNRHYNPFCAFANIMWNACLHLSCQQLSKSAAPYKTSN